MDYRALLIVPLAALVLSVGAATPRMPDDWNLDAVVHTLQASGGAGYEAFVEPASEASGLRVLHLRSKGAKPLPMPQSVGGLSQRAFGYGGQRIQFSAELRAEGPTTWAGLFLTPGNASVLSAAARGNPGVEHRLPVGTPVKAGADWQAVSVVMDVPPDAPLLSVGLALVGEGEVWARNFQFKVVGREVAVTTTPIGLDWAAARDNVAQAKQFMAKLPPQPLANAELN